MRNVTITHTDHACTCSWTVLKQMVLIGEKFKHNKQGDLAFWMRHNSLEKLFLHKSSKDILEILSVYIKFTER